MTIAEAAPATVKKVRPLRPASEARQGLLLVSPTFVYALLLLAAPLALMVLLSFWTQNYLEIDRTLTLANYVAAWDWNTDRPIYSTLMGRSLAISGVTTLCTVVLAYPIAYFVAFHVKRNKALWIFLITIPFWTSYLLRIFLWKVILGSNGVVNSGLMLCWWTSFGPEELATFADYLASDARVTWSGITAALAPHCHALISEPLDFLLYNANAVVIALTHAWAPFAILPIYVALSKIDPSLNEAAEDLGDGAFRRFWRVTLPLSMPGVIAATLIVFIPTVGDYVTPRLVGGSDGLMIANMIQVQFGKANNAPLGAALAISAMLIVTAISIVFLLLNRRFVRGQR